MNVNLFARRMPEALTEVLTYLSIPVVVIAAGGFGSTFYSPGRKFHSAIQHFAAGLVFAAVATGLLPEIMKARDLLPTIGGFSFGVVVMLGMKWYLEHGGHQGFAYEDAPWSLVLTAGFDYLIDGLMIGITFGIGARAGGLMTFALTVEGLFLAIAVITTLTRTKQRRWLLTLISVAFGVLLALGAIAGSALYNILSGPIQTSLLAFGAAALIYLVTEELLVEAHDQEVSENPFTAGLFFVGFLLLITIELAV